MSTLTSVETFYSSLGELIRAWRKHHKVSQEALAERIGVSAREIRRWESRGNKPSIPGEENLEDLAEATRIPFGVILSLAARLPIPVYYSMSQRHYSAAPDGLDRDYSNLLPRSVSDVHANAPVAKVLPIERAKQVERIMEYHYSVYPSQRQIDPGLILQAATDLPQFNMILNDPWGHFAGYASTLLISQECCQALVERKKRVEDLTVRDMRRPDQPSVMFVFSGYAAHCTITMVMMKHYFEAALHWYRRTGDRPMAAFAVSRNGLELFRHFGFTEDFTDPAERRALGMEITPTFGRTTLKSFVNTAFGGTLRGMGVA
ncbi:helix-turn-helix domain-containing protein [Sulfuriroseicoccus oceanibius]|uniref:Helix-turn-helix transcriptional regulator n=1 Tax=Sulfuriroseicoccus oceanibius TaxID=2707525 RepID=A0A6B3LBS5_9BACT|nr:helix-turn-helix transcriptional regulator [Sulfuriroseicoccus oceanibius]QQL45346.1 helix-turn-helix transcriptional regulator [Sulfuriroseicoccus oceanibius]